MPHKQDRLIIFTDGASKGNPGPGGWGAIVADGMRVRELGGREDRTTNNRMELAAALEALRSLDAGETEMPIVVYTDSSYLINGITKWAVGWKRRGWMTQKKEDVLNKDLWTGLLDAVEAIKGAIMWTYVGGHIGIPGNERVDMIASDLAEGKSVELYDGTASGYGVDVSHVELDASKLAHKSKAKSRSKAAAYSYVSEVGGEVRVHATWAECEARVKGRRARFKKATSPVEEKEIIRSFSKP